jgi:pyruvate dehydrogenase E2 component (dihydrolipoamide acetyltransferase)
LSGWRKVALGTWRTVGDPSVYGQVDIDVGPALAYLEKMRASTGQKLTLSHVAGKAVAMTLAKHPEINCVLRWGRLYPRKRVDVFFQVANDDQGKDLSGLVIRDADRKTIPEIAREMAERVEKIRKRGDPDFKQMKGMMAWMPGWLTRFVLDAAGFVMYGLNLWSPALGSPRDPFGSVMITNIGSLGLDMAYAPLVPYSRVPVLIALGSAKPTPTVVDGQLAITTQCTICVTFDHRLIDGMHGSRMLRTFKAIFADPGAYLANPSSPS